MINNVWFWQIIVSPHMAGLARELASMGVKVIYVAERKMSETRAAQGWQMPELGHAKLCIAPDFATVSSLVESASEDSIHICQGIRGNGLIGKAQVALSDRGLRQWLVMETVEDSGWRGVVKRLEYRRLFRSINHSLEGVLAIGYRTTQWIVSRGFPSHKVFPFAYFLSNDKLHSGMHMLSGNQRFRVLFVGQFIERKRLDLLIDSIASIDHSYIELAIVGSGPLEKALRQQAEQKLPGRVDWIGRLPMAQVHLVMAQADILVLPSRFDGWGAVVSEALMLGTPVICSDRCGSAGVVQASEVGGVFASGSKKGLQLQLEKSFAEGKLSDIERARLASWASSLGAKHGAQYLLSLLKARSSEEEKPLPPWFQYVENEGATDQFGSTQLRELKVTQLPH